MRSCYALLRRFLLLVQVFHRRRPVYSAQEVRTPSGTEKRVSCFTSPMILDLTRCSSAVGVEKDKFPSTPVKTGASAPSSVTPSSKMAQLDLDGNK